ncbi:WhiB family transcriptional regulator [Dietzia sp. 179-F 9C3 NHS]|uniref:WhiB family transcriptional regulator n=1 Tax=Dietzia sp. 179-F 9C3 NHS TaxID=3374295 RepID=UPI00387A6ABD
MIPSWHERAKCAGDLAFIERVEAVADNKRRAAARAACAGCPVLTECAVEGLETSAYAVVRAGVWLRANGQRTRTADRHELVAIVASARARAVDRPDRPLSVSA